MPTADGRLSAAELAAIAAALQAQAAVREQLVNTAVSAAVAPFSAVANWWTGRQVADAINAVLRVLMPTQRQAARITDAYLARVLSIMAGRRVGPAGVIDVTRLRRLVPPAQPARVPTQRRPEPDDDGAGPRPPRREDDADLPEVLLPQRTPGQQLPREQTVPPPDVWARIGETYRKAVVMDGASQETARARAMTRVRLTAETDVLLAIREQIDNTLVKRGVTGYRRVPRFERSEKGYGPCGLCVVAADRVYSVKEMLPIHHRCRCEVVPIMGSLDPGLTLNTEDLKALYEAAGTTGGDGGPSTAGKLLKRIRVEFVEHGELGPVIIDGSRGWRGPRQVAAAKSTDRATRALAQLESLERSLGNLVAAAARGQDKTAQIDWHEGAIAKLRRELAAAGV